MDPALSLFMVSCFVGVAAFTVALWWLSDAGPRPVAIIVPGPGDGEPHTLTLLGPNGRPNPFCYEHFPNYPAAWARQQALARQGRHSVIVHTETGEIRIDVSALLGPYGRITL